MQWSFFCWLVVPADRFQKGDRSPTRPIAFPSYLFPSQLGADKGLMSADIRVSLFILESRFASGELFLDNMF